MRPIKNRARMRLTPRQKETLHFIRAYIKQHNYSPALREISEYLGGIHPNAAFSHVKSLEKYGYLRRTPGISRSYVLTDTQPEEPTTAPPPPATKHPETFGTENSTLLKLDDIETAPTLYRQFGVVHSIILLPPFHLDQK